MKEHTDATDELHDDFVAVHDPTKFEAHRIMQNFTVEFVLRRIRRVVVGRNITSGRWAGVGLHAQHNHVNRSPRLRRRTTETKETESHS